MKFLTNNYILILRERVDCLTVEAWLGHLVVPFLGCGRHPSLDSGLVLLLSAPAPVGILTHVGPVQLGPLRVVTKGALICPPLSHGLQLSAPNLSKGGGNQRGPLSLVEECRGSSLIGRELP